MTMAYSADPFECWVLDDFLPGDMAWNAYQHFYEGDGAWTHRDHLYCRAKETRTHGLHPDVEGVLATLEGPSIRHYLAQLAGFPTLHADGDRFGGGQHVIRQGGFLGVHADFTHHPTTGMRRALNLLLYLNPNWKKGDGGELELWAPDMSRCARKVEPLHNRAVVFKTSTTSFHGHPDPLRTSERRSLAVYYYVPSMKAQAPPATPYAWIGGPILHTTNYCPRPWEYTLRLRRWLSKRIKG